jgi:hypothetical protein
MHLAHLELKVVDRNALLKYIATAEDFDLLVRDERFDFPNPIISAIFAPQTRQIFLVCPLFH